MIFIELNFSLIQVIIFIEVNFSDIDFVIFYVN